MELFFFPIAAAGLVVSVIGIILALVFIRRWRQIYDLPLAFIVVGAIVFAVGITGFEVTNFLLSRGYVVIHKKSGQ